MPIFGLLTHPLHVNQRVLTAMTDIKAVYFDVQRQIFFAFVGAVENHRGMMERRQIESSQIHIPVGPIIDDLHAFLQESRAGLGVTIITVTVINSNNTIPITTPKTMQGIFQIRLFLLTLYSSPFFV